MEMLNVNEIKNEETDLDSGDEINSLSAPNCLDRVKTEVTPSEPQVFADDFDVGVYNDAANSDPELFQHVSN